MLRQPVGAAHQERTRQHEQKREKPHESRISVMRHVLAIPLEEVRRHFEVNERQSLKILAPARLGEALLERLRAHGVNPKPETPLAGDRWRHAAADEANAVCESGEFGDFAVAPNAGGFTISFGNQHAAQEEHVHRRHAEIYFSEHPLRAEYRVEADPALNGVLDLPHGGALVFAAGVVHRVTMGGLTIVIEAPAMEEDKFAPRLGPNMPARNL